MLKGKLYKNTYVSYQKQQQKVSSDKVRKDYF